ncbi:MAG TPA: glycosyltransferase family 4 protein [Tepidisphaeraceae bacterium]|nr:glycosyltransferase family 4 protein [Tepidisphaeraceae bacterium]
MDSTFFAGWQTVTIAPTDLRIALFSDSASARFGGEAIHPVHYFRILRSRGIETFLIVNARTRGEMAELFPDEQDRIFYVEDSLLHKILWQVQRKLPARIGYFTIGTLSRVLTQGQARKIIQKLVAEGRVNVVHQPIPLAVKECSVLYDLGAATVVGPLNGAMEFPPAFRRRQSAVEAAAMRMGRWASAAMHWLMPGKLRATTILVANDRSKAALPAGVRGKVVPLIDNCVDLETWRPAPRTTADPQGSARFVYVGRLVDWKAVDLLLEAFAVVAKKSAATLDIIGDGPLRSKLEAQSARLGTDGRARFLGWQTQANCARELTSASALVLPSLYECGGAVVLEAMGSGIPVIATNWGGPADYLDASCGILVDPESPGKFVAGLADAMLKLAGDSALCRRLGHAARQRVVERFDWRMKVDRTLEIYAEAVERFALGQDRPGAREVSEPRVAAGLARRLG